MQNTSYRMCRLAKVFGLPPTSVSFSENGSSRFL